MDGHESTILVVITPGVPRKVPFWGEKAVGDGDSGGVVGGGEEGVGDGRQVFVEVGRSEGSSGPVAFVER